MSWVAACKQYASQSGTTFKLPKKNTEEYAAIKAIQATLQVEAVKASDPVQKPVKKIKSVKLDNTGPEIVVADTVVLEVQKTRAKPAPKIVNLEASELPVVAVEVDKPKKVKKVKESTKVQNVVEEPVIDVGPVIVKPARAPKKVKVQNIEVDPVVEVEMKPTVKMPRKSSAEARANKEIKKTADQLEHSAKAGRQALDDARLLILAKPVNFRFD